MTATQEAPPPASAASELQRTNQLYFALSAVYRAIVQAAGRQELFDRVTRALVDSGAIRMAWVGWAEPASQRLLPVAQAGDEDGYLQAVDIRIDDTAKGRGLSGTAFREDRPDIREDLLDDPGMAVFRAEIAKRRWRAAAAFPLHVEGRVEGVLTVYAHEPGFFRDEKLAVLLGASTDISVALDRLAAAGERRRLVESQRATAERLALAVEAAAIGIWEWPLGGEVSYWDERTYAMFGVPPGTPVDFKVWADRVHPDDRPAQHAYLRRIIEQGVLGQRQYRIVRPDGALRHIQSVETLRRDAEGRPVTVVGINIDVTDRVEADAQRHRIEQELRESQQRYRLMFDASPNAKLLIDRETRLILEANQSAFGTFGYPREELIGRHVNTLLQPEDVPEIERRRLQSAVDRLHLSRNIKVVRKDGSIIDVEIAARDFDLDGRPVRLSVTADVTLRVQAEEQLRQAQKMEAVGQLTGGVAHDFNNILMVILTNVEVLLDEAEEGGPPLSTEQRAHLRSISRSADRAAELTRRLLAFSRRQRLAPQVTNVNDMVASLSRLLRRTLGENIEIEAMLADDLGNAHVDRAQVEAALVNLALNARDAMPAGGRLLIETANRRLEADELARHPDVAPGAYVMLAVGDNGSGIAAEHLPRVFEPFFTTKEFGRGSGLGLSMVYGFVKQSAGHIAIESVPGRGTTVRLYLPLIDAGAEAAQAPAEAPPHGTERLLLVEDDELVRESVVLQLASLGYRVADFARAREALEWLERGQPVDLLLTDVVMPELDGAALAHLVEQRRPGLKILFMSGYSETSPVLRNSVPAGAPLLAKPFRKTDLAHRLRDVLGGR